MCYNAIWKSELRSLKKQSKHQLTLVLPHVSYHNDYTSDL